MKPETVPAAQQRTAGHTWEWYSQLQWLCVESTTSLSTPSTTTIRPQNFKPRTQASNHKPRGVYIENQKKVIL
ncbi:MAG: hypothetical protein IJ539_06335 [Prevotella sp.]|nr:hypothetical protein [Prevotella sp.]